MGEHISGGARANLLPMPGAEREGQMRSLVTQDGELPESVSPRRVPRAVTANAVSGLTGGPQACG